jgi:hypothetical protein
MSANLIPLPSLVATTTFTTGPNDSLAAVDAYSTSPQEVINNLNGLLSDFDSSILNTVASGLDALASLAGAVAAVESVFTVDNTAMQSRVLGLVGGARAALGLSSTAILASLSQGAGLNAATVNAVSAAIGNTVANVNSQDPSTIVNFAAMINALVNGNGSLIAVTDTGAQTSLLSGILSTCIGLGLSALIPGVLASALGTASAIATTAALLNTVPVALGICDLTALQAILDASQPSGQPSGQAIIFKAAPDACSIVLKNFTLPPTQNSPVFYNPWLNQLLAVLTGIDPNWDELNRDGTMVNNLEALMGASADALTILSTEEEYLVMATIAGDYPQNNPITSATALIPDVTFIPLAAASDYGTGNGDSFSLDDLPALTFDMTT